MADKQPEALWLADAMNCVPCRIAAELRRLSAVEAERDALRETERKFGTMMHAVMAERDALRAALELYRGQVDQTGRHSAAEAIDRAVQALGARETPRAAEVLQKPLD